jgi:hypothetical protein
LETFVQTNIIDRCYELANSGAYDGTADIRRQLIAEGYSQGLVSVHMAGPLLKKKLSDFCAAAQSQSRRSPPSSPPVSPRGAASGAGAKATAARVARIIECAVLFLLEYNRPANRAGGQAVFR